MKTIVFDFDGVIHKGYNGYKDGSIYGEIDDVLLDFIQELLKDYYVIISSNRKAEQIVEFMNNYTGKIKFEIFHKDFDNMYWNKEGIVGVTNEKPIGMLYIDDRGYRYTKDTESDIKAIRELIDNAK